MENKNARVHFKEGDEVAHKENLSLKLEVIDIKKTKRKVFGRTKKDKDGKEILDESNTEMKSFIIGIECGWWVGDDYKTAIFHTKSLVPFDVAQDGFVAVQKYLSLPKFR